MGNPFKKIFRAIRLMSLYLRARWLLKFHYSDSRILESKHVQSGKYGKWTASVWETVVYDHKTCKKMHVNLDVPWPVSAQVRVVCPKNIVFHPDDINNFQTFGSYFQAIGKIEIGRGTYIAPNVGIITANHDVKDLDRHSEAKAVVLGEKCWIGMNSVILPGVTLGNNTVVGAGSVVTKSFPEGNCVIAGSPAREIKKL